MMHLIQILLPIYDNTGEPFGEQYYSSVRQELTDRFGGLTAFTRAPAQGLWKNQGETTTHDDIVVFEVMTPDVDWECGDVTDPRLKSFFGRITSLFVRTR